MIGPVAPAARRVRGAGAYEVWQRPVWELSAAQRGWLTAEERAAADRLRRVGDRRRRLARRAFVRERIAAALGIEPSKVVLGRERCPVCGGPAGRPVIVGAPGLSFSCASSGDRLIVALGDTPLGVDIEAGGGNPVPVGTLGQLHPTERAELDALPAAERADAFRRLWTRKEACLKAIGTGIGHGISDPCVAIGAAATPGWRIVDLELGDPVAIASLAIRA